MEIGDFKSISIDYVTFGTYPQSKKASYVTIGGVYDKERGYYLGSDYCLYAECNGSYYKVDPIKWKVLSKGGEQFIVSNIILDTHVFSASTNNNYYSISDIRKWLNDEFYKKAFTESQRNIILTTKVDYDTNDKVFLLSREEAEKDKSRMRMLSDYAEARHLDEIYYHFYWWLRSHCGIGMSYASNVDASDGQFLYEFCYKDLGVVPALKVKIDFDIINNELVKYYGVGDNVIIPDSVTSIEKEAFCKYESLTSVTMPNSVNSIKERAFCECKSLTNVIIPNSVTYIGKEVFRGCKSLANITLSESLTEIGGLAFNGCSSLKELVIPKSVTKIGTGAFDNCPDLNLIFEDKGIGDQYVKWERNRLEKEERQRYIKENFDIQNNVLVKYKGKGGDVTIPDNVRKIDKEAFCRCKTLTSVTIPDSVATIGEDAFMNCEVLTSINVSSRNVRFKSIDGNLYSYNCKILLRYAIGKKEKSFIIPDGVTSIGDGAFYGCSLTQIIIPENVNFVGRRAFYHCVNSITICCRVKKPLFGLPKGWDKEWVGANANVIWNYKGK